MRTNGQRQRGKNEETSSISRSLMKHLLTPSTCILQAQRRDLTDVRGERIKESITSCQFFTQDIQLRGWRDLGWETGEAYIPINGIQSCRPSSHLDSFSYYSILFSLTHSTLCLDPVVKSSRKTREKKGDFVTGSGLKQTESERDTQRERWGEGNERNQE